MITKTIKYGPVAVEYRVTLPDTKGARHDYIVVEDPEYKGGDLEAKFMSYEEYRVGCTEKALVIIGKLEIF